MKDKKDESHETSQRIFGFVARKSTNRATNQCHLFAEQDPDQPARAIVNLDNEQIKMAWWIIFYWIYDKT